MIEITEGLLIKDSSKVTEKLDIFRQHGIKISIDDFGTGFSSLAYLKKFDIDYLKIDRTFINQLHEDKNDRALTESIIMMAHKLGIKTIAEGVKIMAQHDLLASFGSDYSQGFLYSNPLPKTEFESLILTSKNISLIPPHPLTE